MKSTAIVIMICLLGLATAACESQQSRSGNVGPGSFTGDLNNLGGSSAPAQSGQ